MSLHQGRGCGITSPGWRLWHHHTRLEAVTSLHQAGGCDVTTSGWRLWHHYIRKGLSMTPCHNGSCVTMTFALSPGLWTTQVFPFQQLLLSSLLSTDAHTASFLSSCPSLRALGQLSTSWKVLRELILKSYIHKKENSSTEWKPLM